MILPIDRGRFDFERERDLDDLMFSVFPAWILSCPKRHCPFPDTPLPGLSGNSRLAKGVIPEGHKQNTHASRLPD
jgi:hypothetical protein